jgi:hypothetical protein
MSFFERRPNVVTTFDGGLIANGGFEQGVAGWTIGNNVTPTVVDTRVSHTGLASLRTRGGYGSQNLTFQTGKTYLATCWVRTDGAVTNGVAGVSVGSGLWINNTPNVTVLGTTGGTAVNIGGGIYPGVLIEATSATPWTQVSMTFQVTVTDTYLFAVGDVYGGNPLPGVSTWIDDVSVTEVTAAHPNLVLNPSFESGLANWNNLNGVSVADTTRARTGVTSLRSTAGQQTAQAITLQAGVTYSASVWFETDGAQVGGVGFYWNNTTALNVLSVTGGQLVNLGGNYPGVINVPSAAVTAWTQVGMTFTVNASGSYVLVVDDSYNAPTPGVNVWFDDVSVTEV